MENNEINTEEHNGLAVFDRPIVIRDQKIYGLLYNKECVSIDDRRLYLNTVENYSYYLAAIETFINNGGEVSENGDLWSIQDWEYTLFGMGSFYRIVSVLMKGSVGIKCYEFDEPIEWKEGEVDKNVPERVCSTSLIERYTKEYINNKEEKK